MPDPHALVAAVATDADDAADAILGTTIRFFLSSTFADFQTERDVLQRHVFPELRRLCTAAGFRLQPIDLRWGVNEAAATDRQTLRICFDELERCGQLSPDFFPLIHLVVCYCGVTPGTEGLVALLTTLRLAIAQAFSLPEPAALTDENQLIGAVASQLATLPATPERPLLVVIDALDQLGVHTQRIDWLPPRRTSARRSGRRRSCSHRTYGRCSRRSPGPTT